MMFENYKDGHQEFRDSDSDLLLKILNKTLIELKNSDNKELFVDENWKINSKQLKNDI